MQFISGPLFAAAVVASGLAAQAATFSTTGTGQSAASHSFSADGLGLTASGVRCTATACSAVDVQRFGNGLAIKDGRHDDHRVDGNGTTEAVVLAFDADVVLEGLEFSYVEKPWDDFRIWSLAAGGWTALTGVLEIVDRKVGDANSGGFYTFVEGLAGRTFAVATTDYTDAWKLKGVTASRPVDNAPPPVPLPAGAALLLGGLGVLGLLRRRRG